MLARARRSGNDNIRTFMEYVNTTWVSSVLWPPRSWSVHREMTRTNNDVEGWHSRLNKKLSTTNVNLYLLIERLYDEAQTAGADVSFY